MMYAAGNRNVLSRATLEQHEFKGLGRWDGGANETSSTRVFKHQACFTSTRGSYWWKGCVLETRPHRSCKRFRSAQKGQRCYCHILDTYRCSRYKSLHFRFTHTLHATQNVSYSQGTHYNDPIRSNLNRGL